jgi:ATP:ADP antiporter, AAA family
MITDHAGLSRFERLLTLVTRVRPGEGRAAFLFFLHGLLLLLSYQMVKALREAFMLTKFSAEVRSYAVAVIALTLMFLVPLYGYVRRHLDGERLLHAVTIFFAVTMLGFVLLAWSGASIAFIFFVWVSIYGVMVIAQLWAYAADSLNLKSGQRLFPVIMLGANIGALVGAKSSQLFVAALTPLGLMLVATAALAATMLLVRPERAAVARRHRSGAAGSLPAVDRTAGRAAQLGEYDG